jgi:Mg2+-importing ATPase
MPQLSLSALFERLKTSEKGLSSGEAQRRLLESGPNEPTPVGGNGGLGELLRGFANPLVVILLVASVVSAALGELVNASIIVTIVLLSLTLNFIQTYRSHRAVRLLRQGIPVLIRKFRASEVLRALYQDGWAGYGFARICCASR